MSEENIGSYASRGEGINCTRIERIYSVFTFQSARTAFQDISGAFLLLCINPKTKDTLWVTNCAEADAFFKLGDIDENN
jgi:hypothetical protein